MNGRIQIPISFFSGFSNLFRLIGERSWYQGLGAGNYTVKINVENGTVEDILYDSALAGNS